MRHTAINNLYSNVSTQVNHKAYDNKGNLVEIDEDKVAEEVKRLQAEYDSKSYARARADAYPSWQDQMDLLYHGGVDALKAELKKTKDKYPKPT